MPPSEPETFSRLDVGTSPSLSCFTSLIGELNYLSLRSSNGDWFLKIIDGGSCSDLSVTYVPLMSALPVRPSSVIAEILEIS